MPSTRAVWSPSSSITIAEDEYLALAGAEGCERQLQLGREPFDELGLLCLGLGGSLFAPVAPGLRPEPVEGGRARDPEQPGPGAAAAWVEPRPLAEGLLERGPCQVVGERAVAGQVEQVAEDVVEMPLGGIGERGRRRGGLRQGRVSVIASTTVLRHRVPGMSHRVPDHSVVAVASHRTS